MTTSNLTDNRNLLALGARKNVFQSSKERPESCDRRNARSHA